MTPLSDKALAAKLADHFATRALKMQFGIQHLPKAQRIGADREIERFAQAARLLNAIAEDKDQ